MSNRIEQVIGDIEEYIDGCKMQAFSNTKIIVDRPQIEEYLDELRQYTPEEVKKYQRMLNNRDKILMDAKQKASDVEEKAQAYAERLVAENNITKMAYEKADEILQQASLRAQEILNDANQDAETIRNGAFAYTNEMMSNLLSVINSTLEDCDSRYKGLMQSLAEHQHIVRQNLNELKSSGPAVSENDEAFRLSPNEFFSDEDEQ